MRFPMKMLPGLLTCCALVPVLQGEPPATPRQAPAGTLLTHAPELAAWTVTVSQGESPTPAAPSPPTAGGKKVHKKEPSPDESASVTPTNPVARIAVTKGGGILHFKMTGPHAEASDKWCKGEIEVTTRADWSEAVVSAPGNRYDAAYVDYSRSDFPELAWISRKNYAGIEKISGHACMVFKDHISVSAEDRSASPDASAQTVEVTAYIDYYSRLPVLLSRAGQDRSYEFEVPPEIAPVFPPEIQKVVEDRQNRLRELSRTPQHP